MNGPRSRAPPQWVGRVGPLVISQWCTTCCSHPPGPTNNWPKIKMQKKTPAFRGGGMFLKKQSDQDPPGEMSTGQRMFELGRSCMEERRQKRSRGVAKRKAHCRHVQSASKSTYAVLWALFINFWNQRSLVPGAGWYERDLVAFVKSRTLVSIL